MTKEPISNETKEQICQDLSAYVEKYAEGSANRASKMLKNVSNATISNVKNGKWESIADEMWRNIQKQVSIPADGMWVTVDTSTSRKLTQLILDCGETANVYGIIADEGTGKSETLKYGDPQRSIYKISCNEYFNRKTFLMEIVRVLGIRTKSFTLYDMMNAIVDSLRRDEYPVLIFDEIDKIPDQVLYFFISLYNALEGKCGIILMATSYFETRIVHGVERNKKGYREIFSRLGKRFINLPLPNRIDQRNIIMANGIHDDGTITSIINDSENDLRRVKRLVHAAKKKGVNHAV